jgi:hypothetical protein
MSTHDLIEQKQVTSDLTPILTEAFDTAWARLKASGSPMTGDACQPPTRALLAKRIIETAQNGETDVNRLVEDALSYLAELK